MKMMNWLMAAVLMTGVCLLAGCGKGAGKAQKSVDLNGMPVAIPELQLALANSADKDVQTSRRAIAYGLRYGQFASVQAELTKMAANPSLTEDQKKLAATVEEQFKQAMAQVPAPPTQ